MSVFYSIKINTTRRLEFKFSLTCLIGHEILTKPLPNYEYTTASLHVYHVGPNVYRKPTMTKVCNQVSIVCLSFILKKANAATTTYTLFITNFKVITFNVVSKLKNNIFYLAFDCNISW